MCGAFLYHHLRLPFVLALPSLCESFRPGALWSGLNKNRDVSTGPLAGPFASALALLTRSLAPDCSLRSHPPLRSLVRSRPPLRSLVRSLSHFAHSLARGKVNY